MKIMNNNIKEKLPFLLPFLPLSDSRTWDKLDPKLYHGVHIYWLKFYGLWFYDFLPNTFKFWLRLLYTAMVLWLVCFFPGIGEIIYLLKRRDNIGDVAEGEMYTYFKLAVFWLNKQKITRLLQYLYCEEFKPTQKEHKDIILKSIKRARFVMSAYSAMCVCAVSVGIVMPLTENFEILPTNVEYHQFNVYKSPAYGILYSHHIYYKPATCIIDGVMDTILAAFIASAIGQIEILSFNLRNFDKLAYKLRARAINDRENIRPEQYYIQVTMKECIKHHNSIIRYVSMIEDAFSLASALQFMLSVMVLCLVGIQFLSIEDPRSHPMQIVWMAIYLWCMLTEVFILCWFGDELIWKSQSVRQAAFEGPWLKLDVKTAKYIVIFLERCKRPLQVTAGKIFTLSLGSYTILINWAYKAFAVMSNMKK
nr:odorant receptor 8 [Achelura yunnanensis]